MEYAVDIVLAVIFVLCVIIGWRKGFFRSFMDLASNIIAFFVAKIFSAELAPQIFGYYFEPAIFESLKERLAVAGSSAAERVETALESIPESLTGFMTLLGVDEENLVNSLSGELTGSAESVADTLMTEIISPIVTVILKAVIFVALFVIAVIILRLISKLLDKLAEAPFFKQANALFGLALGAVKGVIVVCVICFITEIAAGFINNDSFSSAVSSSAIISAFDKLFNGFVLT